MDEKKALEVLGKHKDDLVYVRPEDLQTQRMFVPQVTIIPASPSDFHDIQGQMMPKAHHTYRIGEAAGVDFIDGRVEKLSDTVWVGRSQGRKRQPDGSWKKSNVCEYEFDAELRAQKDSGEKSGAKYERKVLEYRTYGRQRAESGAKARVIRELVGIPTSFTKDQINRAFVVSRIAVNTDELLDNPETRKVAVEAAMNGAASVYGPKDVTPEREALPEPEVSADGNGGEIDDFDTFDAPEAEPEEDPRRKLRIQLDEWLLAEPVASSPKARSIIDEVIAKGDEATAEEMQAVIKRCQDYASKKSGKVAS